jgi:hypothetical protein
LVKSADSRRAGTVSPGTMTISIYQIFISECENYFSMRAMCVSICTIYVSNFQMCISICETSISTGTIHISNCKTIISMFKVTDPSLSFA